MRLKSSNYRTKACALAMAALLAGALTTGAAAQDTTSSDAAAKTDTAYSGFFVFGDGISDAGVYLVKSGSDMVAHRWVVNPGQVWAEILSAKYSIPMSVNINVNTETSALTIVGGNNYAQGGARVSQMPGIYSHNTHSMKDQVDAYLASTKGVADAGALYSLEAGSNDIFYQGEQVKNHKTSLPQAKANIETAAGDLVALVKQLVTAGAKNIIVFNVQDIAATPLGNSHGMFARIFLKKDANVFNETLQTGLMDIKDANIIYVDTYDFLNKVIADPGSYKFTNVTDAACSTPSAITCTADTLNSGASAAGYLYADQVRPGSAGQAALAAYVQSLLAKGK